MGNIATWSCVLTLVLVLSGCGDDGAGGGVDSGGGGVDSGGGGVDSGGGGVDSGGGGVDSGGGGVDSGGTADASGGDDAGGTTDGGGTDTGAGGDGAALCSAAGVECADYQTALAAAPRGASGIENCVIQMHQLDCCGAMAAYGVNHAARTTLCPAEDACLAEYGSPDCSDDTITTDTGDTTTNIDDVKVRLNGSDVCETFVCSNGSCAGDPGVAGGCG